jgi:hypothetical protein
MFNNVHPLNPQSGGIEGQPTPEKPSGQPFRDDFKKIIQKPQSRSKGETNPSYPEQKSSPTKPFESYSKTTRESIGTTKSTSTGSQAGGTHKSDTSTTQREIGGYKDTPSTRPDTTRATTRDNKTTSRTGTEISDTKGQAPQTIRTPADNKVAPTIQEKPTVKTAPKAGPEIVEDKGSDSQKKPKLKDSRASIGQHNVEDPQTDSIASTHSQESGDQSQADQQNQPQFQGDDLSKKSTELDIQGKEGIRVETGDKDKDFSKLSKRSEDQSTLTTHIAVPAAAGSDVNQASVDSPQNMAPSVTLRELIEKLVNEIQVMHSSGETRTSVTLQNPPFLKGAVIVISEDTKSQKIDIQFTQLSPEAQKFLEGQKHTLNESLTNQGFIVADIKTTQETVPLYNYNPEREPDQQQGRQQGEERQQKENEGEGADKEG